MTLWQRLKYGWFATVTVIGVIVVLNMLVSIFVSGAFWGTFIFSPLFVLPVFVVACVVAPILRRWLSE